MPKQRYVIQELKGISDDYNAPKELNNLQVSTDGLSLIQSNSCQEAVYCQDDTDVPLSCLPSGLWECLIGCDQKGYASFSDGASCWLCNRKDSDCCGDENGNPNCRTGNLTKSCRDTLLPEVSKTCAFHLPATGVYESPSNYYLQSTQKNCDCFATPIDCCTLNPTVENDTQESTFASDYLPTYTNPDTGIETICTNYVTNIPEPPVRRVENCRWVGQWVYYVETPQGKFAVCRKPAFRSEFQLGGVSLNCPIFISDFPVIEVAQNTITQTVQNIFYDEDSDQCRAIESWELEYPSDYEITLSLDVDAGIPEWSCLSAELYIGKAYTTPRDEDDDSVTFFADTIDSIEWQLVDIATAGQGVHNINGWTPLSVSLTNDDLAIYPAFGDIATVHNTRLYSVMCCCVSDSETKIIPAWEYTSCAGEDCLAETGSGSFDVKQYMAEQIQRAGGITPEEFVTTPDCMTIAISNPATDGYGGLNMGWRRLGMSQVLPSSTCITGLAPIPPNENGFYGGLLVFGDMDTAIITGDPDDSEASTFSSQAYNSIGGMDKGTKPAVINNSVFTVWQGEIYLYTNGSSQLVSSEVDDPSDPFTEIVAEPQNKSIIGRTKNGRLLRFDFETQTWSNISLCEGVDPCNIHLLPSPDCYGTRYYDDSTGKVYVVSPQSAPPITGTIQEGECGEEQEAEQVECDCNSNELPEVCYDIDADSPGYNKSWCSIQVRIEGSCDIKPILCELSADKCKRPSGQSTGQAVCVDISESPEPVSDSETIKEARNIGGEYWQFDLPKGTYGTNLNFRIKFCGDLTGMKIKAPIIVEYRQRGKVK